MGLRVQLPRKHLDHRGRRHLLNRQDPGPTSRLTDLEKLSRRGRESAFYRVPKTPADIWFKNQGVMGTLGG